MKNRIYKVLVWLLTTVMVLFAVAGCGGTGVSTGYQSSKAQLTAEAVLEAAQQTAAETEQQTEQRTEQQTAAETEQQAVPEAETEDELAEDGIYTSKEEVALYIHTYGHLPENYITKKEAESLGWNSKKGNLWDVAPGMSIGGSHFGNYEGLLPEKKGRKYYECDLDYEGGYRGAKRLIYSNDGLIFYTEDHYESFEQLY